MSMEETSALDARIAKAEKILEQHLQWIARHDTRAAFLIGIEVAMLGYVASKAPFSASDTVNIIRPVIIFLGLKFLSFACLFMGNFPNVTSPNRSLIFFGTISERKYLDYRTEFCEADKNHYLEDLLCQIHVNACILTKKFKMFKWSMLLMLVSIIPWVYLIYVSATL